MLLGSHPRVSPGHVLVSADMHALVTFDLIGLIDRLIGLIDRLIGLIDRLSGRSYR